MLFVPLALLAVAAAAEGNAYSTYPAVPKTASINGFADPIYDKLPACAQSCVTLSTSTTPCPYWDTGCLCVMTPWGSNVADCVAEKCKGSDVASMTSLATSLCQEVGAWEPYWIIDGAARSSLSVAAAETTDA